MSKEQAVETYLKSPTRERLLTVLRAHQDRVYNVCFQVLRHAQDAEDAAQRVLLKLAEGAKALPDPAALRRWVYRVAMTTALDLREARSRRQAHERRAALMKNPETQPPADDDGLHQAVASLEPDLGDLILRHYFEKATLETLAREQQCSEVAVWKKIEKGKERLREILTASGSGLSVAALAARLDAIVPVQAPAMLLSKAAAAAGLVLGGLAVAAKTGLNVTSIAAAVALLAAGVGGGILLGTARSRREVEAADARATEASARLRDVRNELDRLQSDAPEESASAPTASAPAAAASPTQPERAEALRERLRKLARLTMHAQNQRRELDFNSNPEAMKEVLALMAEYGPFLANPSAHPEMYTNYVRIAMEVVLEELGAPLTEAQRGTLAAGAERMRDRLKDSVHASPQDRGVSELRAYRELVAALRDLNEDQLKGLSRNNTAPGMPAFTQGERASIPGGEEAVAEIARIWTRKYELEDAQKSATETAARVFSESWNRITQEFEARAGGKLDGGSPSRHDGDVIARSALILDYHIATFESQRDALRMLEASLKPEQQERMRGMPMVQFQRVAAPR